MVRLIQVRKNDVIRRQNLVKKRHNGTGHEFDTAESGNAKTMKNGKAFDIRAIGASFL